VAGVIRTLNLGPTTIQYEITRSQRRRRTVEVSLDGTGSVRVAAPMRVSLRSIEDFLLRRRGWLTRQLAAQALRADQSVRQYGSGEAVRFLGERLALLIRESTNGTMGHVRALIGAIEVSVGPATDADRRSAVIAALECWYRSEAEAELRRRVAHYTPLVHAPPVTIKIGSQKHLWGSCSPKGALRFNWRLIMAPPPVVDYVVVHELCHLRHPHHQKPFWDAVGAVLPDYRERRAQLRRDGDSYRL
jgi:predicted metal-dependent hydrolase